MSLDTKETGNIAGSFRDPAGSVFYKDGIVYRRVNKMAAGDYDHLMRSGLYDSLAKEGLLIPHEEIPLSGPPADLGLHRLLKPRLVPFISYPYEWCFGQLKSAALATIKIQLRALEFGMSLKDASAYNIQFQSGHPVLIDTLSFGRYRENDAWIAYRQFCQHFLAPLALISFRDARLNQLSKIYLDGIPLDLASSLLPARTRLKFSLLAHLHVHARCQAYFAQGMPAMNSSPISLSSLLALIENLKSTVESLEWQPEKSEWSGYYDGEGCPPAVLDKKKEIITGFLKMARPKMLWDLGANTGLFSRIAAGCGTCTVSLDADHSCVEKNYRECVRNNETNILPLVMDLINPSPAIGWANAERGSLMSRGPADAVLALALVHHLAISNNLPFSRIAEFFGGICKSLMIEFVPADDPRAARLISARRGIFHDYSRRLFEEKFSAIFEIRDTVTMEGAGRVLYLMSKR